MSRATLFLLKEDFRDGEGAPYFCPDCAMITGILAYFPKLRYSLDIQYADFARPRSAIVDLVGPDNQGCPVLILNQSPPMDAIAYLTGHNNGRYFVSGAKAIASYFAYTNKTSRPH